MIAAENPLRSVAGDAEFVASILKAVEGPIVLVWHSYSGIVITNAARDNVKALVNICQEEYHQQFAEDVPAKQIAFMAVGQRPVRDVALNEASGPPAWKSIPSWFVFGELDKNIPVALKRFMGQARRGPQGHGGNSSHMVQGDA